MARGRLTQSWKSYHNFHPPMRGLKHAGPHSSVIYTHTRTHLHGLIHIYVCIYTHIYACAFSFVHVCSTHTLLRNCSVGFHVKASLGLGSVLRQVLCWVPAQWEREHGEITIWLLFRFDFQALSRTHARHAHPTPLYCVLFCCFWVDARVSLLWIAGHFVWMRCAKRNELDTDAHTHIMRAHAHTDAHTHTMHAHYTGTSTRTPIDTRRLKNTPHTH